LHPSKARAKALSPFLVKKGKKDGRGFLKNSLKGLNSVQVFSFQKRGFFISKKEGFLKGCTPFKKRNLMGSFLKKRRKVSTQEKSLAF